MALLFFLAAHARRLGGLDPQPVQISSPKPEAFSLLANPCHYWVSEGGRNFLPQFMACFPSFSSRLCIGHQLSPHPKISGRQTTNISSNMYLDMPVYGMIILSICS